MAQPQPKSSPLSELCSALPSLPARLQQVGRFVAANDYDATTRSMRDLAAEAGADPASFTRLAKALGYSGWDELRAALTEARRPAQASPFSARTRAGRKGPHADIALVADKLEAEAAGLARISAGSVAEAAKALHAARRIWIAGFRSCRSVAELLNYQLRLFRSDDGATGRRFRPGRSRPRRLPAPAMRSWSSALRPIPGPACCRRARRMIPAPRWSRLRTRSPRRWRRAPIICCSIEAAASPGFFPSLTGAIAIAQSLAAVTFVLGGAGAKRRLEETEGRLAAMSQYVAEKG